MTGPASHHADVAALARGGRTSFFGFVLRLAARLPFLFIAGQLYGAESLGRWAYATMVVELMAQLATLGLKRGLAAALAKNERPETHVIADALLLAWLFALAGGALLAAFPSLLFPKDATVNGLEQLIPLIALAIVGSDVTLAALAYRHRIGAQVTARSIVEPWTLTLVAAALAFTFFKRDGLILAYALSLVAALVASIKPCIAVYGMPHGWRPSLSRMRVLARENAALAGADAIDWGSRRIDLMILGLFADSRIVGIYYVAQQVTSLVQKLKTSFDPVLAPVMTKAFVAGDKAAVAAHARQVAFWIIAAQLGVALALGLPGAAVLGLVGPEFTAGAIALGILLAAEVLAATGAVAEAALIYVHPKRNLSVSMLVMGIQVTATLLLAVQFGMVGAAAGLAVALLTGSVLKARMLRAELGEGVLGLRWSLLLAAAGATAVGVATWQLPHYWRLAVGVPAILGVYCGILWVKGFRAEDRLLFAARRA